MAAKKAEKASAGGEQPVDVIARLLLLDPRRIQQLAKEGVIPKGARGRYPLVGAVQGYIKYLRDRIQKGGEQAGAPHYETERARMAAVRRQLYEAELERVRGETVPLEETTRLLTAFAVLFRQRLLSLPDVVSARVFDAPSIPIARERVMEVVHGILDELADAAVVCEGDLERSGRVAQQSESLGRLAGADEDEAAAEADR